MLVTPQQAVTLLKQGDIVALPTETVYGLAACYDNEQAIAKIFSVKQRPLSNPLIVHISSINWLQQLCIAPPDYLQPLLESCWPGPLTVVLKKSGLVSNQITANQSTVAIRMPNHTVMQQVLNQLNTPLVAPSANRYCQTSPTSAAHVKHGLGDKIAVVDGGNCNIGIESTILDCTESSHTTILRPGMINRQQIETITQLNCHSTAQSKHRVPGQHKIHYAPTKPIYLIDDADQVTNYQQRARCFLLNKINLTTHHNIITMPAKPEQYASKLYQLWHDCDAPDIDIILVEKPPKTDAWAGINDRLNKAARR